MNQPRRFILPGVIFLVCCATGIADVRVEFPLGDYYRPGRYVPVRIVAGVDEAPPRAEVRISADGAVTTAVSLRDGHADAVVPWLVMLAPLDAVSVTVPPHPAVVEHRAPRRPLAENERLVGHTPDAVRVAVQLFPNEAVIPVSLNTGDPLPGHPAAWEALDALLLDRSSYRRLRVDAVPVLLSAGTVLAVLSADAPDDHWPWVRSGEYWVLRLDPAGPAAARFDERHYEPAHAWRAEWPASFRRQVLLLGVLAGCLAGAAALWRSRFAPAAVVLAVALCMLAFSAWRSARLPVPHIRGDILVQHGPIMQRDAWHYQAPVQPVEAAFAWQDLTRPVLAGQWHLNQTQLMLRCRSDGEPAAFVYHLPRAVRIAFVTRQLDPAPPPQEPRLPITSPLERMVRTTYLQSGDELPGEIDEVAQHWPTILLRRPR
jgi:hypothetical protein